MHECRARVIATDRTSQCLDQRVRPCVTVSKHVGAYNFPCPARYAHVLQSATRPLLMEVPGVLHGAKSSNRSQVSRQTVDRDRSCQMNYRCVVFAPSRSYTFASLSAKAISSIRSRFKCTLNVRSSSSSLGDRCSWELHTAIHYEHTTLLTYNLGLLILLSRLTVEPPTLSVSN